MPKRLLKIALLTISAVGLMSVAVMAGYLVLAQYDDSNGADEWPTRRPGGALLICGGGEVPDEIYRRFVHLGRGAQGRLVVIPSYSPTAAERNTIIDVWTR